MRLKYQVILLTCFIQSAVFSADKNENTLPTINDLFQKGYIDELSETGNQTVNFSSSVEENFEKARRGNVTACYNLGQFHLDDNNEGKAFEWFDLANHIYWFTTGQLHIASVQKIEKIANDLFDRKPITAMPKPGTFRHLVVNTFKWIKAMRLRRFSDAGIRFDDLVIMYKDVYSKNNYDQYERLVFIMLSSPFCFEMLRLNIVLFDEDIGFRFNSERTGLTFLQRLLLREKLIFKTFSLLDERDSQQLQVAIMVAAAMAADLKELSQHYLTPSQFQILEEMGRFLMKHREHMENLLGELYRDGLIGRKLTTDMQMRLAAQLFEAANTVEGNENLGMLYADSFVGSDLSEADRIEKALILLRKSPTVRAQQVVILLLTKKAKNDASAYRELNERIQRLLSEFPKAPRLHLMAGQTLCKLIDNIQISKEERLAFIDAAEAHLLTVDSLGFADVKDLISSVHDAKRLLADSIDTAIEVEIKEEVEQINLHPSENVSEEKSNNNNTDVALISQPQEISTRKTRKADKKIRATLRHQDAYGQKTDSFTLSEATVPEDLAIKFYDAAIEKDFAALDSNKKVQEIFADIILQPWGLLGAGKPEILRFGQFKGCYSRRIDSENRLVYKVLDDKTIMIVSCRGHYGD